MKNLKLAILLIGAIGILLYLNTSKQTKKDTPIPKEQKVKKISGAYKALNFMAARQSFPSGKIPAQAYSKGWERAKKMTPDQASKNFDTNPWESMGPHNRGGRTLCLAFNPQNSNTLYAGSASGGLWRSYTAGVGAKAWERVDIDLPVLGVSCITFAPNDSMTMFIGTGEVYNYFEAGTGAAYRNTRGSFGIGILKSTDGGVTWSKSLDWSLDENHGVWAIRIDPFATNTMYAATTQGVYKSTDSGENWTQKFNVVMANDLIINSENSNTIIVGCGNLDSPGSGIYRSIDGGNNWTQIYSELPIYKGKVQFGVSPSNPNVLYASIGNSLGGDDQASWLLRSSDFGYTWELKNTTDYSQWQGWFSHDVAVHPTQPNEITIIGINVWQSSDGGQNIVQLSSGGAGFSNPTIEGPDGEEDYVHSDAHDVLYHPDNPAVIYIASDGGIHRSLDGGATYSSCNGAYQTAQFYNGFSNSHQDSIFCMGGLQDNGTIRWNGDKTWRRVLGGDGSWSAINPDNDDIYYTSWQYLNIIATQNGGDSTTYIEPPFVWVSSFIAPYIIAPSSPNVLYSGSAVVGKSSNHGESWITTNSGVTLHEDRPPVLSMAISHQDHNKLYVATAPLDNTPAMVFKTVNGSFWINITHSLPNRYPMDMAVDPTNDNIAYITYAGFGTGHVFKTEDSGATWQDISQGLPDVPTNAVIVDPLFPSNVYVGNDLGVFASPDGGDSWEVYQDGMPGTAMVFDLKISPTNRKLRVATHGNGAYQRDLISIPVSTQDIVDLDLLELKIYPNPASEIAHISYKLYSSASISFSLLDANSKIIQRFDQQKKAAGNHQFKIPVNHLSSGMYYLQIKIGNEYVVRRVVVL